MTTESSCGTCRFHDRRYSQNRNGHCTNPDSPRAYVVTGPQGLCAGHKEGSHLTIVANQMARDTELAEMMQS
jgi:hypothetical protein